MLDRKVWKNVTLAVPLLVNVRHNTQQLLQLNFCRHQVTVLPMLRKGNSPLNIAEWRWLLRDHPDAELVQYLLTGITEDFRIGYNYSRTCISTKCNLSLGESRGDNSLPTGGGKFGKSNWSITKRDHTWNSYQLIWNNPRRQPARQVETNCWHVQPKRTTVSIMGYQKNCHHYHT